MKIKKHITALATVAALSATLPAVAQQSQHMAPETMLSLARVGASALSPDGKTVVYSVGFPSIKDNKIRTELLIYPDENHWILRPQNALLWQRTFFGWLDKYLK